MSHIPGPARSVSVIPRMAQLKVDKYFQKESVKRNQNPSLFPLAYSYRDDNLKDPLADLRAKLNIREEEKESPKEQNIHE